MRKFNLFKTALSAVLLTLTAACSSADEPTPGGTELDRDQKVTYPVLSLSALDREIAENQNEFGYDFFQKASSLYLLTSPNDNVILSPVSASITFSIYANGTNDEQARRILDEMGVENLTSLNEYNAKLMRYLPLSNAHYQLKLENKLWVDDKYSIDNGFSACMNDYYDFTPENGPLKSDPDKMKDAINSWCYNFTDHLITKIVSKYEDFGRAYVANAVVFKSLWKEKFKLSKDFNKFLSVRGEEHVDMIESKDVYNYAEIDGAKVLQIPYIDDHCTFTAIVPPEDADMAEFISDMSEKGLSLSNINFQKTYVWVVMPKLSLKGSTNLIDYTNIYLGFNNKMDWVKAGITDEPDIANLKQTYSLDIDEDGTTAAIVTSSTSIIAAPFPGVTVFLNRPFVFFITEKETGAIILAGVINTAKNN